MCRVLQPVSDTRIAPLMATKLMLGTEISRVARKWLLRFPETAVHGLIPVAVGPLTKARKASETALRYMAHQGFENEIKEASSSYNEKVRRSIEEILLVAYHSDYHQKKLPTIPISLYAMATPD